MYYVCGDKQRREAVRRQQIFNGIDFLRILERPGQPGPTLEVHFIHELKADALRKSNVRISGGSRIRDVKVSGVSRGNQPNILQVELDREGDYSTYSLQVEADHRGLRLDPQLSAVDFTFKSADVDCCTEDAYPAESQILPEIDYMARDYASFRQLMLDRISLLLPQWQERSAADPGMVLVEILAYVADHLSYQQDVIATESYLSTARRRISVRRHARLLDYNISEGCNARVWVQIRVNRDIVRCKDAGAILPSRTRLLTKIAGQEKRVLPEIPEHLRDPRAFVGRVDGQEQAAEGPLMQSVADSPVMFETMHDVKGLYQTHNEMRFYTWGRRECCLPKGATSAALLGTFPNLQKGDVLVFTEVYSPHTGRVEDADPAHRHAVRLTKVTWKDTKDPIGALPLLAPSGITGPTGTILIEEWRTRREERDVETITITEEGAGLQKVHAVENIHVVEQEQAIQEGQVVEDHVEEEDAVLEADKIVVVGVEDEGRETARALDETHLVEQKRTFIEEPDYSVAITEIEWDIADALPFPLYLSATTAAEHGRVYIENVSVALGNIVLADQGELVQEKLDPPQKSTLYWASAGSGGKGEERRRIPVPARYYPSLKYGPLTYREPFDESDPPSATVTMHQDAHEALPVIELRETLNGGPAREGEGEKWECRRDLLCSEPTDRHFVVEREDDTRTFLRFGDGRHGLHPEAGMLAEKTLFACYRQGNGIRGNIGAETLYHVICQDPLVAGSIQEISNPLPAQGGSEPERIEDVRQMIARAFSRQDRGVTPDDYIAIAGRQSEIEKANAVMRWTGSWSTVFLAVERKGGLPVDEEFKAKLSKKLECSRMAGGDLVIVGPTYVPLEIALRVRIDADHLPGKVQAELQKVFSNKRWPDGTRGIFHPDNCKFGQPVYLSTLLHAAHEVSGVTAVAVSTFRRLDAEQEDSQPEERLPMGWSEIARLENNPDDPEQGIFRLYLDEEPDYPEYGALRPLLKAESET